MSLVVITGGVRSGKSRAAERLCMQRIGVVVLTAGDATDEEMSRRIERHRESRPAGFETREFDGVEGPLEHVERAATLLVDCMGALVARLISGVGLVGEIVPADVERSLEVATYRLVDGLIGRDGDTVVVTNEVGSGIVPAHPAGRLFRDLLGNANKRLIEAADGAWLAVGGRMIDLKAARGDVSWPQ